jgi:NTP pyrophosphatase (non-canonical NTP hydrolase)
MTRRTRAKSAGASPTLAELTAHAVRFRDARDWKQFHNAKDLALTLSLEAAEVLEHMQWKNGAELEQYIASAKSELADELADVLHVTLLLAEHLGVDLGGAFANKMKANGKKYPVHKARGTHRKYDKL